MNDRHGLIAFMGIIVAICVLSLTGKGTDAVVVGLVGVLGTFKPRTNNGEVTVTNGPSDPIPVKEDSNGN